jgi:hypothetical protein
MGPRPFWLRWYLAILRPLPIIHENDPPGPDAFPRLVFGPALNRPGASIVLWLPKRSKRFVLGPFASAAGWRSPQDVGLRRNGASPFEGAALGLPSIINLARGLPLSSRTSSSSEGPSFFRSAPALRHQNRPGVPPANFRIRLWERPLPGGVPVPFRSGAKRV